MISIGNRTYDGRLAEIIVHTVSSRREDKTTLGLWRVVIIILRVWEVLGLGPARYFDKTVY